MSDDLHKTLLEDGRRWRATVPTDPDPATVLDRVSAGTRSTRWRWPAIAAAISIVLIAAGWVLVAGTTAPAPSGQSGSSCQNEFDVDSDSFVGTKPSQVSFALTYAGARPCSVSAYGPWAALLSGAGARLGTASHTTLERRTPVRVRLSTGQVVTVQMGWNRPCSTHPAPVSTVLLHMSGMAGSTGGVRVRLPVQYRLPPCVSGGGDKQVTGHTNIEIGPPPASAATLDVHVTIESNHPGTSYHGPWRDAAVRVEGVRGERRGARTDQHGDARLRLTPGTYQVTVTGCAAVHRMVTATKGATTHVTLHCAAP